ncbi:MAG: hypothetical protein AAGM38_08395 [Pseudomonadota bacterium]
MRIWAGLAALLGLFIAPPQSAVAQSDLCARPSEICGAQLPTSCVRRFAAGALAADVPEEQCAQALSAYRSCLASVSEQCGETPPDQVLSATTTTPSLDGWVRRFDGRIGKISVSNPTLYPFEVTLWHPDSGSVFGRWTVNGQSEVDLLYEDQIFNIGNDWGLQFGDAAPRSVGEASEWSQGRWLASSARFFQ